MISRNIHPLSIILFFALCGTVIVLAPFAGMKLISPLDILSGGQDAHIFLNIRIPRTIIGFTAGSGLALCGMVFQALFHNPLATPFTLGISSGASFGASLTIILGLAGSIAGVPVITFGSFLGAVCSMGLVYGFSSLQKRMSGLTMLLAGISVSFMFSSLLMFVQFISDLRHSFQIVRWLMGGLEVYGYAPVTPLIIFVAISVSIIALKLTELDHILAGEDIALVRGVNVNRTKTILFFATSLCVGAIVSICGPIGFIGMMSPHICRLMFGARHRVLGLTTAIFGGTFLVACDTFARVVIAPAEIPVGVITALAGGPFFLWILFRHVRNQGKMTW